MYVMYIIYMIKFEGMNVPMNVQMNVQMNECVNVASQGLPGYLTWSTLP